MVKRLLIIPAKGNSKRIPNKNIKYFCGKPMISYVLNIAKKSNLFTKVHVSTESKKIKRKVEKLGFKIDFMRPSRLSKDKTPVIDVLKFVFKKYLSLNYEFDEIWTISCCSPLLLASDLKRASYKSKKLKKNVLLATAKYRAPIQWAFQKNNNNLKPFFKKKLFKQSQSFEHSYYDAGAFAVFPSIVIKKKKLNLENRFVSFELPPQRAVDIDNLEDLKFAEFLFKARRIVK